jgi:phosphatidylglycerol:prolipoprotein diacylglycerol transferase
MFQELFHFHLLNHTVPVYGYGFMLVVAFLACVQVLQWLARRVGINPDLCVDATLIGLSTGILGARLCHVFENLHDYTRPDLSLWQNLHNIFNIHEGGLTFYGGFLLATPCCIAYAIWRKVPIRLGMDIIAPTLMVGLALGRIGCFLNGCCYGQQCDLPWSMQFPYGSSAYMDQVQQNQIAFPPELISQGALLRRDSPQVVASPQLQQLIAGARSLPVQPTQLYSAFTGFLLAWLLVIFLGLPHADGQVFALMLMLEGLSRFVLELIRVEPSILQIRWHGQAYGMSTSMVLGIANVLAGIVMWYWVGKSGNGGNRFELIGARNQFAGQAKCYTDPQ